MTQKEKNKTKLTLIFTYREIKKYQRVEVYKRTEKKKKINKHLRKEIIQRNENLFKLLMCMIIWEDTIFTKNNKHNNKARKVL